MVLTNDHNPQTGEIRALLCCDCNTALGLMNEDTDRIFALIEYINKFKS